MAAKQKRSHAVRGRGGSGKGHGLAWFLAGALAGGLATWVVLGRDPAAEQVRATVERTVGHSIGVDSTTPPAKPKFEFYTLLPEMEVVVPDEDLAAPGPAPPESSGTAEVPTSAAVEDNAPGNTDPASAAALWAPVLSTSQFSGLSRAGATRAGQPQRSPR